MKKLSSILLILSLCIISSNLYSEQKEAITKEPVEELPLDELVTLTDVYAQIKSVYVKELTDKEILDNAIKGMLSNLDPHSRYLSSDGFDQLEESARGEYAGIGIRAEHLEDGIHVRYIFGESPAKTAGLKLNDRIVSVNGVTTKGLDVDGGSDLLRGEPHSKILLEVISENQSSIRKVSVIRQIIQFTTVNFELIEPNIGYARIGEFQTRTSKDLTQAITKMETKNKKPLSSLILDLRNNPGGLLDSAVAVSDLFLHQGMIVSTKGRIADSNQEFRATSGDILRGRDLVVLINNISASASEIVAGALQDHKRATILGTQSYGKGSVQTIFTIHGGGGVKLTTALYYTPNERSIQDLGITPDKVVEHIKINSEIETDKKDQENKNNNEEKKVTYKVDNQVVAAVELLTKLKENPEAIKKQ